MESTAGMQRALPPAGLFDRVAIRAGRRANDPASIPAIKWIAAAILLIIFNVGSIIYALDKHDHEQKIMASNTLFSEIQTASTYNY